MPGSATTSALAEAFMQRFAGLDCAYGTYDLTRPIIREDGKKTGTAITRRAAVTIELWERHLRGEGPGLGIIPIRADNTCVFGAIDIDMYAGFSHQALVAKLKRNNLPLIVCRSKSGGAHVYLFSKVPVPASKMKAKLSEVASFLGHGDCEIFPKQTHILVERGDAGQWLNACYFNGIRGMRYAVNIEGDALSPEQFLDYAGNCSVESSWFNEKIINSSEFVDGPPCLQALAQVGYATGTRNDGLLAIGVYLKKSRPDSWENDLAEFNFKYMQPPLTMPEVQGTAKSLKKKDYTYACTKQPICSHCDAALCRTRKYGVGGGTGAHFPVLGGLTKLTTKPPQFYWSVNDIRMELSTAELQDPRAFQRKCIEYLNLIPAIPSRPVWEAAVQHALDTVMIIDAPSDASPEGQFMDMLEKFCTQRAQAQDLNEIVLGKPYTENGTTYFRMTDLLAYLQIHKFVEFKAPKIASIFRDMKAVHDFKILKGRPTNFWGIKEFARQTEEFKIPEGVKGGQTPF